MQGPDDAHNVAWPHPIPPEDLRVFPQDSNLPKDQLNTKIDESFVPLAEVAKIPAGKFAECKAGLLKELCTTSFRYFPVTIPAEKKLKVVDDKTERLTSEEQMQFGLRHPSGKPAKETEGSRGFCSSCSARMTLAKRPTGSKSLTPRTRASSSANPAASVPPNAGNDFGGRKKVVLMRTAFALSDACD